MEPAVTILRKELAGHRWQPATSGFNAGLYQFSPQPQSALLMWSLPLVVALLGHWRQRLVLQ